MDTKLGMLKAEIQQVAEEIALPPSLQDKRRMILSTSSLRVSLWPNIGESENGNN